LFRQLGLVVVGVKFYGLGLGVKFYPTNQLTMTHESEENSLN
jgi:hypothetical protein